MSQQKLLKDELDTQQIVLLSEAITLAWPDFERSLFIEQSTKGLDELALKQRVNHIINVLAGCLPSCFEQTAEILINAGEVLAKDSSSGWSQFIAWPLIDYVAIYGLDDLHTAMKVLERLTGLFTAEFAIRPFISEQFDNVYPYLQKWSKSEDEHLRRLASEGTRPLLPWAEHLAELQQKPERILPILEQLKDDDSLYVRKSVANHLNDISKTHPEWVLLLCQRWQQQTTPQRSWIIKRALRTLIKQGHPKVFPLLGMTTELQLTVNSFSLSQQAIQLGESVELILDISSTSPKAQSFILDYRIHYVKANHKTSQKVFKWKTFELQAGERIVLHKTQPFIPISTRRFYSGMHRIEVLLNGDVRAESDLLLSIS